MKEYVFIVRSIEADFGEDVVITATAEKAYEIAKKFIDKMPEDNSMAKDFKKEAYDELNAKFVENPENYFVEDVVQVFKVKPLV